MAAENDAQVLPHRIFLNENYFLVQIHLFTKKHALVEMILNKRNQCKAEKKFFKVKIRNIICTILWQKTLRTDSKSIKQSSVEWVQALLNIPVVYPLERVEMPSNRDNGPCFARRAINK